MRGRKGKGEDRLVGQMCLIERYTLCADEKIHHMVDVLDGETHLMC